MDRSHRGTIFVEDAEVLEQQTFEGEQFILTIRAPRLAAAAEPGAFAHIRCDDSLPMRRPLSIMLTDGGQGTARFLYKRTGRGTALLADKRPGDHLNVMGPIGRGFRPIAGRPRPLLIGGGVGIPPMVFLASRWRSVSSQLKPLVLMGSEVPFPFDAAPSQLVVPGMPDGVIASMPLMEDWGVASRLASGQDLPGCHQGFVTDLARAWLGEQSSEAIGETAIYACGPTPMLKAAAALAAEFDLPSQLCLEEFMACAVGGCAGCVVGVREGTGANPGVAMRRVCVDGPVFDGASVVWQ